MNALTLYLEQLIEAPLLNLFAILGEVDLFKHWVPLTKKSDIKGEYSHLRKLAYFVHKLPWPFVARECFIQASGFIVKGEKAAVLSMSTVESDTWFGVKIEKNSDWVTTDINKAFIYAKILSDNSC